MKAGCPMAVLGGVGLLSNSAADLAFTIHYPVC